MTLKEKLIALKRKIHKVKNHPVNNIPFESSKEDFNIDVSQENGMYIIEISDYITISDYLETIKSISKSQKQEFSTIDDKLTMGVLWNSSKQKVNKGIYYAFSHNNKNYNILRSSEGIIIEERTKIGEETQERIIDIDNNFVYHYFSCMHDKNGSSYLTRYYSKNGVLLKKLELSKEEFCTDLTDMLNNLSSFDNIESIIDISVIKNVIIDDINLSPIKK